MRRFFLAFLAFLALAAAAEARLHAGPGVMRGHRMTSPVLPLDGVGSFASPSVAFSFRKVKSSYTGPGLKLRRATGGTQDISFLGFTGFTGAPLNAVQAATFCAATSCFLDTWYDQSGLNRHFTQPTAANQPQYIADCGNGMPCLRLDATGVLTLVTASVPWTSASMTMGVVARRTSGTSACFMMVRNPGSVFQIDPTPNTWSFYNSGGLVLPPAADGVWHSGTAVFSPTGVGRLDGVEATGGGVFATASAGTLATANQSGMVCEEREMLLWDGYGLAAGERAALTGNQASFWGF